MIQSQSIPIPSVTVAGTTSLGDQTRALRPRQDLAAHRGDDGGDFVVDDDDERLDDDDDDEYDPYTTTML